MRTVLFIYAPGFYLVRHLPVPGKRSPVVIRRQDGGKPLVAVRVSRHRYCAPAAPSRGFTSAPLATSAPALAAIIGPIAAGRGCGCRKLWRTAPGLAASRGNGDHLSLRRGAESGGRGTVRDQVGGDVGVSSRAALCWELWAAKRHRRITPVLCLGVAVYCRGVVMILPLRLGVVGGRLRCGFVSARFVPGRLDRGVRSIFSTGWRSL